MKSQQLNQDNQWQAFLETGRQPVKAIKPKEIIDVHKQLKAKYSNIPMPTPGRIIRTVSSKQRGAVIFQRGGK